ncbi:MAG TPA: site-2 protease family protein [Tepidisphaeraceae bacterium]|jgi:Zn-dependent protease
MTQATVTTFPCPQCGNLLYAGMLVCSNCHGLVYVQRLNRLAADAMGAEQSNPAAAARIWRECLPLLPPDSQQYHQVQQRIGLLMSGFGPAQTMNAPQSVVRPNDPWPKALAKTLGSMVVSIIVYSFFFGPDMVTGLLFASGFVLLILVHEMGHVFAMRFYGLRASPPIFIPFLGALINLRERPRNALEEAVVGIGGPFLGTVGSMLCYLWYLKSGHLILLPLAYFGFLLNFFNMLPVPPLDGGRITAAVTPWIWVPGLLILVAMVIWDWFLHHRLNFILILVLLYAWPRVRQTLIGRDRENPYYQIGLPAAWAMGTAYAGLSLLLAAMYFYVRHDAMALLRVVF